MVRRRRTLRGELAFFWRLTWPGFAAVVALNELLGWTGSPMAPPWFTTPLAIVTMLAAAWWRDRHPSGKLLVLSEYPSAVVHVLRRGEVVETIVFAGRPNPLAFLPDDAPSLALASAAIIEYVAGDLTFERLETDLDFYLRGKQPCR